MSLEENLKTYLSLLSIKAPNLLPTILPSGFSNDIESLAKESDLEAINKLIQKKVKSTKFCCVEKCSEKNDLQFLLGWTIDLDQNTFCLSSGNVFCFFSLIRTLNQDITFSL
jgi:hypothetical protein